MKICCANVTFVLVRPLFLGNIGAVARVLKNFSFTDVRLVLPPRNYKDAEARKMSVGAFDVLKKCQTYSTLSEALKDVSLAVGTTSGQQRRQKPLLLPALTRQVVEDSQNNLVAFVFGDERDGLSVEELARCHVVATVPTNPQLSSLNMAQAVGIFAYEISRQPIDAALEPKERTHPSGASDDQLFAAIEELLEKSQFTRKYNHGVVLQELRSFYQRAYPTERQASIFSAVVRRINSLLPDESG